jgi:plasmid stabilization system protein ParE
VVEGEGRHSQEPVSYELVLRGRAKADIRRAAKWYEKQREGLGVAFVSEVDNAIRRIEVNPEQFQVVHQDIRHAITRRFPYGVFYRIRKNRIVISAVLHLERSDVPWQGKGASPEEPG